MRVLWLLLAGAAAEDALDCFSRGGGCAECCGWCTPYKEEIESGLGDTTDYEQCEKAYQEGGSAEELEKCVLKPYDYFYVDLHRENFEGCACVDTTDKVLHHVRIGLTERSDCIAVRGYQIDIHARGGDDVIVQIDPRAESLSEKLEGMGRCEIYRHEDPHSGNRVNAGRGDDSVLVEGSGSYVYGDSGNDLLIVVGNDNTINGNHGDDAIEVSGNANRAWGGFGDDDLRGNDVLSLESLDRAGPSEFMNDHKKPMMYRLNRLYGGDHFFVYPFSSRSPGSYHWPPSDADRCNDGFCIDTKHSYYDWAHDEFGFLLPGEHEKTRWSEQYYGARTWLKHEYTFPDQCPWSDAFDPRPDVADLKEHYDWVDEISVHS